MQQTRVIGLLVIVLVLITAIGYIMYQAHSNKNAEQPVKIVIQQQDFDQTKLMMETPQTAEPAAANQSDPTDASASDDADTTAKPNSNSAATQPIASKPNNSGSPASPNTNTSPQVTTPAKVTSTPKTTVTQQAQNPTTKPDSSAAANASTLAWAVQVASLSDDSNAKKLINQLKQAGFAVFTRQKTTNGTTFTQVFLGPELDKDKAEDLVNQLKDKFKMNGVVVKYQP